MLQSHFLAVLKDTYIVSVHRKLTEFKSSLLHIKISPLKPISTIKTKIQCACGGGGGGWQVIGGQWLKGALIDGYRSHCCNFYLNISLPFLSPLPQILTVWENILMNALLDHIYIVVSHVLTYFLKARFLRDGPYLLHISHRTYHVIHLKELNKKLR